MRIAILDDQIVLREGLKHILLLQNNFLTIRTYGANEVSSLKEEKIDFLILDVTVQIENMLELVEYFISRHIPVVVFTNETTPQKAMKYIRQGISGYLLKSMRTTELIVAIETIQKGCSFFHPIIADHLLNDYMSYSGLENKTQLLTRESKRPENLLTNREWEVLDLLTKGYTNTLLSEQLSISDKTVKVHVSNILKKLKVSDRTAAVVLSLKREWTSLPDEEQLEELLLS